MDTQFNFKRNSYQFAKEVLWPVELFFIKLGLEWFSIWFNHVIYYFYNLKTYDNFEKIILFG